VKTYWDSSALILALHDADVRARFESGAGATRLHALTEIFSTLTKGVNFRYSPADAAKLVRDLARDLEFVELSEADTLAAVESAGGHGVRGARIHDLMHAMAAAKAKCAVLFTLDQAGFSGLKTGLKIEEP
jgi:predicted nucleic acid-binding protein